MARPVSGSERVKMSAVISIRYDSSSPRFQSLKTSCRLGIVQPQAAVQDIVGFGDELHVAILDAVMHHLDVVTGTARPHVSHARLVIDLGADGLENGFDQFPGFGLAAGHDGRTPQRALFAAADAGADVDDAFGFQFLRAAFGVQEEGVAAVDEQVARRQNVDPDWQWPHRPVSRPGPSS